MEFSRIFFKDLLWFSRAFYGFLRIFSPGLCMGFSRTLCTIFQEYFFRHFIWIFQGPYLQNIIWLFQEYSFITFYGFFKDLLWIFQEYFYKELICMVKIFSEGPLIWFSRTLYAFFKNISSGSLYGFFKDFTLIFRIFFQGFYIDFSLLLGF